MPATLIQPGKHQCSHLDPAFVDKLVISNPEAMRLLKNVFWQGTEHWDELLAERAKMSGKLVLSEFTVNAINKFKKKS